MIKELLIAVLLVSWLVAPPVRAAGIVDIKQKARDVTKQPAPPAGPTPKTAPATGNGAAVPEAQQQNITRLQADLAALMSKTQVTPGLAQQFQKDLLGAVQGPSKPGRESISRLAEDITAALAERKLSATQQARLAKDLHVVLNSAYSAIEAQIHGSELLGLLKSVGVGASELQSLANDLKAIAGDLQRNAPKA